MPEILDNLPPEVKTNLDAIFALRLAAVISTTLIVHDWIRDLRKEASIWRDFLRGKWTTTLIAFLIQRYTAQIAAWAAFIFLFGGPEINCQALSSTVYGANVVFAASVSYIFAQRTFALYNFNRLVMLGLYALIAGLIACYIIVAVQYKAVKTPASLQGCNCALTKAGKISLLGFAASLVFDGTVLVLTLGRLWYLRLRSELGESIRSTSIIYFASVSTVNLALVLIISIANNPTIYATPLGPAFAVTYLLLNRMIFGMRDRSRKLDKNWVGMATEHLEHYKKNRQQSRSRSNNNRSLFGGIASHLGMGSGGQAGSAAGTSTTAQNDGGATCSKDGSNTKGTGGLEHGIPMSVTVAQNSSTLPVDPHSDENLFAHLRSQAFAHQQRQASGAAAGMSNNNGSAQDFLLVGAEGSNADSKRTTSSSAIKEAELVNPASTLLRFGNGRSNNADIEAGRRLAAEQQQPSHELQSSQRTDADATLRDLHDQMFSRDDEKKDAFIQPSGPFYGN